MELVIWIGALAAGALVMLLAIGVLATKSIVLAKKLKPFAKHLARFQQNAEHYPEAVKFFSDLSKDEETAAKQGRRPKG